ncbi:MAG: glycosyltransferase [Planctomycetota bacterium]|nr:glycosyltransferase [Planctomycetota bacterium]
MTERPLRIANFIPSLAGGGAERVVINLCKSFPRDNVQPILVTASLDGPFVKNIPADVEVVDLGCHGVRQAIRPLRRYLSTADVDLFISHMSHTNLATLLAARPLRRRNIRLPTLAIVEHMTMSAYQGKKLRDKFIRPLARRLYQQADHIVAVSHAAARDLETELRLPPQRVITIYNPVVSSHIEELAAVPLTHPFLDSPHPLLVAAGRLSAQKDFTTLLKAFAHLQSTTASQLVILGDGEDRGLLEALIKEFGLTDQVCLFGFTDNPYQWMRRADLFVLSSRWEALPTVLIEAIACGCNVISTDCPSGPAEIMGDEFSHRLVPLGNPQQLARGIEEALQKPLSPQQLRDLASRFEFSTAAQQYIDLA